MSALITNLDERTRWIPIDVAAQLLDKSEGHMRRICPDLMSKGLATKILVGGAHKWHIAASYSPRLIRQSLETDADGNSEFNELLKTTSQDKISDAQDAANILIAFRKMRLEKSFNFPTFIEAMTQKYGRSFGKSRLYKMHSDCPPSEDFEGIVVALIDRRGRKKGDIKSCSDIAWRHFCEYYLTQNQRSLSKCCRMVDALAKENGWAWPSESRVRELVNERLDNSTITLKREGQDAWNRLHLAPMGQDPNAWEVGQCWESDHSKLDFHCRVFKGNKWTRTRPQLTSWFDRRSRMLMGYHISEQGNAYTIRLALLNALRDEANSVPEIVWLDNGKDFMASSIAGITKSHRRKASRTEIEEAEQASAGLLNMLGIKAHFAKHYNHNGKARQERFYGTVHGEFDKEFASYCGYKPGMLDQLDQLAIQKDIMNLPTLDEVRAKFAEFEQWYNARSNHKIDDLRDPETFDRLSPMEFYKQHLPSKRVVKQDALKLLEPVWSKALKVQKNGIGLRIGGGVVRYGELMPELEPLVGSDKRVFISWNPDDMTQVTVWSQDYKFICIAQENGRYGGLAQDKITLADRNAGFAARKQQRARAKQKVDFLSGSLTTAELASRAAREREVAETKARMVEDDRTRDPNDLPPLRLAHTRVDDAPSDIEEQQHRKAVGAEMVDPDEFGSIIDAVRDLHLQDEIGFVDSSTIESIDQIECDGEEFSPESFIDIANQEFDNDLHDADLRIMDHLP